MDEGALRLVQPGRGLQLGIIDFDVEIRALGESHVFFQEPPLKTPLRLCAPESLKGVFLSCGNVANVPLTEVSAEPFLGLRPIVPLDIGRLGLVISQSEG